MINVLELKSLWVRKGLTQSDVAKSMKMSDQTFRRRLKKGVFGSNEIEQLINLLEITDPMNIFFAS